MLAPAAAQAPAITDSSRGWSGASTVSSVTPRAASKPTLVASRLAGRLGRAHEARVRDLVRQVDLEPIGRIVPRDVARRAPPAGQSLDLGAEFGLRLRDALRRG